MDKVKIDVSRIPAIEVKILSRTLLEAVERFYSDPENCRRFEEWQKSKKEGHSTDEGSNQPTEAQR